MSAHRPENPESSPADGSAPNVHGRENADEPTDASEPAATLGLPGPDQPPGTVDYRDGERVQAVFHAAAKLGQTLESRRGSTLHLPATGTVILTGDLHDHTPNLEKILHFAGLHRRPDTILVLHEVIHGSFLINGCDLSVRTLLRVAALQLQYPGRVVGVLSNHELAQYRGEGILKDTGEVTRLFNNGLDLIYGSDAPAVAQAVNAFIRSLPLAIRLPHRILFAHSLPAPRLVDRFDPGIIDRDLGETDLQKDGDAYRMVWGRRHTEASVAQLGEVWQADLFITGHQPAEMGYEVQADRVLILASDHEHGMILPLRLDRPYTMDQLVETLIPISGIMLDE